MLALMSAEIEMATSQILNNTGRDNEACFNECI